jgi:hypothetical protein
MEEFFAYAGYSRKMDTALRSGIVMEQSLHSVDETVSKLRELLRSRNIMLFAVVDHSGEADRTNRWFDREWRSEAQPDKRQIAQIRKPPVRLGVGAGTNRRSIMRPSWRSRCPLRQEVPPGEAPLFVGKKLQG